MTLPIFQADAFTNKIFGGNPAAVVPLYDDWLPKETMQSIAAENNLAETAFILLKTTGFHIRWFTPSIEVRLCGHATLASAHVLWNDMKYAADTIVFDSLSGPLTIKKLGTGYEMDFPADFATPFLGDESLIAKIVGASIKTILQGKDDILVIVNDENSVKSLKPDFAPLKHINARGVIVSALGDSTDFVSRCFYPEAGVEEDSVTGSAHTLMTPYWSKILNNTKLTATQVSARRGDLICTLVGDRVLLQGNAVTYLRGEIFV